MSVDFQSTKFFMGMLLLVVASLFVVFKILSADAWLYYTTGIFATYCGATLVSRSKFMKK